MKLDSKISAIVTGGASGLGEATARMLAAQGVRVAIFDLNEERGRLVAGDIGGVFCNDSMQLRLFRYVLAPMQRAPQISALVRAGTPIPHAYERDCDRVKQARTLLTSILRPKHANP